MSYYYLVNNDSPVTTTTTTTTTTMYFPVLPARALPLLITGQKYKRILLQAQTFSMNGRGAYIPSPD